MCVCVHAGRQERGGGMGSKVYLICTTVCGCETRGGGGAMCARVHMCTCVGTDA